MGWNVETDGLAGERQAMAWALSLYGITRIFASLANPRCAFRTLGSCCRYGRQGVLDPSSCCHGTTLLQRKVLTKSNAYCDSMTYQIMDMLRTDGM